MKEEASQHVIHNNALIRMVYKESTRHCMFWRIGEVKSEVPIDLENNRVLVVEDE
jgi:hypothetical protein